MTRELTDAAKVAKEIRTKIKELGIKASVKSKNYSGGDSVTVYVSDIRPEIEKQIEEICKPYQMGHFDGMTDCYEYSNWNKDIPQTKYLFIENRPSDEMIADILNWLDKNDYGKQFETDEKVQELYGDWSMDRLRLARKIYFGKFDMFGGFWNKEVA